MTIRILCVGKIKERFYREACGEYLKRLSRYAKIEIVETPDERTPEGASKVLREQILKKEGARLLAKIRDGDYVCALAIEGKTYTSEGLASHLAALQVGGHGSIAFVIGGSLGLSGDVLMRADEAVSFSALTFPHQLMRVILLEQLYRSFRIQSGEPYHK